MNPSIIYGAGCQGVALLRLMQKNSDTTDVHCFVDSNPAKQGLTVEGLPVYPPDYLIPLTDEEPTVAVAVGGHYPTIRRLLERLGLEEDRHFYDATPRPLPYSTLEPDFCALRDKVRKHTLVSEDRLALLYQLSRQAFKVNGDLAEIGVYRGALLCSWLKPCDSALSNCISSTPSAACRPAIPPSICTSQETLPTPPSKRSPPCCANIPMYNFTQGCFPPPCLLIGPRKSLHWYTSMSISTLQPWPVASFSIPD